MNTTESSPVKDPVEDIARLEEIAELGLLSDTTDPLLQEAVDAAGQELDLPIALVSIVLDGAQYFAAMRGVGGWIKEARGTPGEWSFCANTVRTRKEFIVEDATQHPLVKDNPLVQVDGIRCYAGVPLITSKGHVLGAFCVIGTDARQFSAEEIARLKEFGRRVVKEIEKRRPV